MTNCHKVMELCTGSGVIPVMLGMEYPDVDFMHLIYQIKH